MFNHWKWLGASLTALLVLGLVSTIPPSEAKPKPKPPPEPALPSYTMTLIPLPAGYTGGSLHVWGMNSHGDVVGSADELGLARHACLYMPETGTVDLNDTSLFPVPDGWTIQDALDINDSGQIAGCFWRYDADGQKRWHAYRYTPYVGFEDLHPQDGSLGESYAHSSAVAINELGDVAGYVESDSVPGAVTEQRAFVWTEEGGMKQIVPVFSYARDINGAGQVTGSMSADNGETHAYRYSPPSGTTPAEVKDLGVVKRLTRSGGAGINNLGQVAGSCSGGKAGNWEPSFLYSDSTGMVNLGTLSGNRWSGSWASTINDSGHVAGESWDDKQGYSAFLYTDEAGMVDLVALIANPPAALSSLRPESMNDFPDHEYGQICGRADVDGGAFVLTPDR